MNDVLERFLRQATQDDYLLVPDEPRPSRRPGLGGVLVAVAAALLGVVIVAAAVTFRSSADVRTSTQAALSERVGSLTTEVQDLQALVVERTATVDELRIDLLDTEGLMARDAERNELAALGGVAELSGPGVVVTIDDAPDAAAGSLNRVLDRDLQDIVNALWRMGAQGIAVNGQRLTQTSAIRGAGEAILVNYQPLTRPYVVAAVGTSSAGPGASDLEQLLDVLGRDYGLVSDTVIGDVALPAGETHESRFAITAPQSSTSEGAPSP